VRLEVDAKEAKQRAERVADETRRNLRDEQRRVIDRIRRLQPQERVAQRDKLAAELVRIATDGDDFQRGDAVKLLAEFGEAESVATLIAYIERGDNFARWQAFAGLVRIKDPSAAEPMARYLRKEIIEATKVLIAIGPPAEPAVAKLLDDSDESIQRQACEILGTIGTSSTVPALKRIVDDGPEHVRSHAREAISAIERRDSK
jgi:HEAT repeat protein